MEVLALNLVEKTLLKKWEKLAQSPLKNLREKQYLNPQIYRARKTSRWGLSELPVDRPVDRQRSFFRPLEQRSTARSTELLEQRAELSAGRPGLSREQKLSGGRPGRSTGPPVHKGVHVCARWSTAWSTDFRTRSTGRSTAEA